MKNGLIIDAVGIKRYYLNDELHRVDGPAIEWVDRGKFWYLNGEQHRVDGPASVYSNGDKDWFLYGKRHRVDGPAQEYINGNKFWLVNDIYINHPKEFETMEEFIQTLNDNEEYSLPYINDINGMIEFIKKPTGKQSRLHAMRWKI